MGKAAVFRVSSKSGQHQGEGGMPEPLGETEHWEGAGNVGNKV